ncbi:carbohydrate sulfotransferase 11-like [Chelonus insularis]|uniref:carbohydrate sulfotransferase 11-like n=1 Tax=Chelonus insularis TaxID=460826 RepID=UPI00158B98EC|nr:carbohydrate sulfotransferase 11-like [Chelonus insularis]
MLRRCRTMNCLILLIISFILVFILISKPLSDNHQENRLEVEKLLLVKLEQRNSQRILKIQTTCKKYNLGIYHDEKRNQEYKYPPAPQYGVFYIDQVHKLSYCPIYKAGSTSWLYNMCLLMNVPELELNSGREQLSTIARRVMPQLDFPEVENAMLGALKLLIVRHPFERLLSAYRDKLENSVAGREHGTLHFYRKYGAMIVKKYRAKNLTSQKTNEYIRKEGVPAPAGIEPTWQEFVDYLIDTDLANYGDDHWMPYYLYCTPCSLNYSIIAKVETLQQDQMFIIKKLGEEDQIQPKWRHSGGEMNASKIYFRQLDRGRIDKLYKKFKLDFEMFDYSLEEYYSYASS